MRTLKKNKQRMYYATYSEKTPKYEYYTDKEGVSHRLDTGKYSTGYNIPIAFEGSIAFSKGEASDAEFGYDVSSYDATLVLQKGATSISENSLIWHKNEVRFKDSNKTQVDEKSAEYKVLAVKESLNEVKYLLGKLVK